MIGKISVFVSVVLLIILFGCTGGLPRVVSGEDYKAQCQQSYSQCTSVCSANAQSEQATCLSTSDCNGKWLESEKQTCMDNCNLRAQNSLTSCSSQCSNTYQTCINR